MLDDFACGVHLNLVDGWKVTIAPSDVVYVTSTLMSILESPIVFFSRLL